MTLPCIIPVAITGSLPKKKDNPAVPISISERIESTQAAYEAGAMLVHLHVRNDDETPTLAPERFAEQRSGKIHGTLQFSSRWASIMRGRSTVRCSKQVADLCEEHGRRPATVTEARQILGLTEP